MVTEIFIEGRKLDINADISSLLTFAIDDVKDFSSRQTAYSKTVVLPGTSNNNAIFGNIFEVGISNAYDPTASNVGYNFNAAVSAKCIVFQDNLQTFKGTLRLLAITNDKNRIEYEAALNGELTSLSVALSSKLLTDLDFSAYDHVYGTATITGSWAALSTGYYYPMIDYGTRSANKHDWDIRTFKPALFVREYIDKMFTAANFRWSSTLFNTNRFKRLIIPHNSKRFKRPSTYKLNVSENPAFAQTFTNLDDPFGVALVFPIHTTVSDFTANFFSNSFTYTGASPFSGELVLSMNGSFVKSVPSSLWVFSIYNNGVLLAKKEFGAGSAAASYIESVSVTTTLNPGDVVQAFINHTDVSGSFLPSSGTWNISLLGSLTARSLTDPFVDVQPGDTVFMNSVIPENIRQVDFLVSIVKLFNLYVYEDRFDERKIYITPFVGFYSQGVGSAVDWSYKLNRNSPIKIKPLSELNSKIYTFNYKEDNDYYNDLYKKRYNQGYGSHIYDTQYEFASQTNKLEIIFAPTPLVGYAGEEKVYPTIFKRTGDVIGQGEEVIDSVIRIMQTRLVMGVAPWDIKDGATVLTTTTNYGYAGHFDDPDNPGNDLNFGIAAELFFSLSTGDLTKTQFNLYWSAYMAEITSKDSKLVSAKFYLTPKDIFSLDFSQFIYVDGVLFRLNKIADYNASIPSDCEVELLRVIETAYSFPPGSLPGVSESYFLLVNNTEPLIDSDGEEIEYV